jgi:hypothetical protein
MLIVDVLGWLGAVLLLLAYWRVSHGLLDPKGRHYQWLNVAGGALLIVNSAWYGAFPSVAVNVVWILVGLQALLTWRRRSGTE